MRTISARGALPRLHSGLHCLGVGEGGKAVSVVRVYQALREVAGERLDPLGGLLQAQLRMTGANDPDLPSPAVEQVKPLIELEQVSQQLVQRLGLPDCRVVADVVEMRLANPVVLVPCDPADIDPHVLPVVCIGQGLFRP